MSFTTNKLIKPKRMLTACHSKQYLHKEDIG